MKSNINKLIIDETDKAEAAHIFNDPHEWFFGKNVVPDNEPDACLIWEYARESRFISDTVRRSRALHNASDKTQFPDAEEIHRNVQLIHRTLGQAASVFMDGHNLAPGTVSTAKPPLTGSFPASWQSLQPNERKARQLRTKKEAFRLVPIAPSRPDLARDFAQWYSEGETPAQREERELLGRPAPAMPPPRRYIHTLYETVALDICWSEFTNKEIKKCFAKLLDNLRLLAHPGPDKDGRNPERTARAALKNLGAFRLFRYSTVAGLSGRCPRAYKYFDGQLQWEAKRWNKAIKEARQTFENLFPPPFPQENPRHAR